MCRPMSRIMSCTITVKRSKVRYSKTSVGNDAATLFVYLERWLWSSRTEVKINRQIRQQIGKNGKRWVQHWLLIRLEKIIHSSFQTKSTNKILSFVLDHESLNQSFEVMLLLRDIDLWQSQWSTWSTVINCLINMNSNLSESSTIQKVDGV